MANVVLSMLLQIDLFSLGDLCLLILRKFLEIFFSNFFTFVSFFFLSEMLTIIVGPSGLVLLFFSILFFISLFLLLCRWLPHSVH